MLSVIPVPDIPMIAPGDDLGAIILAAIGRVGLSLDARDVVVVAQKVVSKAEGRIVALADIEVGAEAEALAAATSRPAALASLILAESQSVMRARPGVIVTRHRTGHVLANAGIDASNVAQEGPDTHVLLWPVDPDASARAIREALGGVVAVVISDSLGRAWRMGTMGTAIGSAGMKPVRDRCGETDLFGRVLQSTRIGIADEIAAAASLVIGEAAEGTPVAIVRGAPYEPDDAAGIGALIRPVAEDLFP